MNSCAEHIIKEKMRKASRERETRETRIKLEIDLDGAGRRELEIDIPFFEHMLDHLSLHSRIDLFLKLKGDIEIDCHHSVEDTAIVLGQALREALGDKKGIARYGHFTLPMDETLTTVSLDLGGRSYFSYQGPEIIKEGRFGIYDGELTLEFLQKFAVNAGMNLHVLIHYGDNRHHLHESIFKALGRSLRQALQISDDQDISSTKGALE